jgi:hypothetical protein
MDTSELSDQTAGRSKPGLGNVIEEFRPSPENIFAGIVIALLLLAGGLGGIGWVISRVIAAGGNMPAAANHEWSWLSAGLLGILFAGLATGGGFVFRYARGLRSYRIAVYEHGLLFTSRGSAREVPWKQIHHVEVLVQKEYFPLKGTAKHALPMGTSRSYTIHLQDDWETSVGANEARRIGRFGQLLEEYVEKCGVEWRIVHTDD